MPKKVRLPIVLLLAFALALGLAGASGSAKVAFEPWGPHVDEIIMPIIKEAEALRIAFERGESVVWTGLTRPEDIDRAKVLSNTELTMTLGFHMFYLCFNMREEPLANQPLRQAVAHCTDRDNIIRTLFKGYMLPMTSFIPQVSPFYKADVPVYPFSHAKAAEVLDKAGYTLDPVTKVRIDPKTGKPLREMKIFTPTYEVAPTSAELGKMIADSCQKVGLPVVPEPMDFPVMLDKLDIHEFDMYVLAWNLSRNPTSLYSFFHSSQDVEAGYNRPGIRNSELDKHLEALNWAPDFDAAQKASDAAQLILAKEMPYVPLYSRPFIDAFRTDLVTGYVPMKGYGAASYNNAWTVLNIRRVDRRGNPIEGGTIRWSLQEEPKNLNPCVASSAYEWEVLSRLYDGLQQMHPDTLEDMPWMAYKWDVGT
jgi:peptide/nickel transport system substrate-binding protein